MTADARTSVTVYDSTNRVVGWVSNHGCSRDQQACQHGIANGCRWHAVPRGFAQTLPTYHYATLDEATAVLIATAAANPDALDRADGIGR